MRTFTLLALLLLVLVVGAPAAAPATTSDIVVGELYAGGGNSGATFANDYVELFNRSSATVDVTGWTLQYASAASSSWDVTPLTGTIAPGGHFLVALASGGTVGAPLPAADATGSSNLALSGGKVAVVAAATGLTCGATAGSCASVTTIHDLVGYGAAADHEGSAAAALTSTTALARAGGGCTDTNDNAADFATGTPVPSNAASAPTACGSGGSTPTSTASVGVALDLQSVLGVSLDRTSVSFGNVVAGSTPTAATVTATVTSNNGAGYSLTVHRTAFSPADLPLGIARSGLALTAIPVAPAADLQLASTSAPSAPSGDPWPTSIGFLSALPVAASGHYSATVTYTVIAR